MAELTLDIISRAMFSSDSELIKDTLYRSSVRYQAEMTLSPLALIPGANRVWALYKTWRAARMLKDLNALMGQIIDARKKRPNAGSHVDLLDRLPRRPRSRDRTRTVCQGRSRPDGDRLRRRA